MQRIHILNKMRRFQKKNKHGKGWKEGKNRHACKESKD